MANKKNGTIYTGVTNHLERRVAEHKSKSIKGFTQKYGLTRLVYFEVFDDIESAIHREKQIKSWNRAWKLNLIEEENPAWMDLSEKWCV